MELTSSRRTAYSMANITATLFGGPFDGKVIELEHAAVTLKIPRRENIIKHVKEGGKLPRSYTHVTYELEMWTGETACMYVYKEEDEPHE
jgi:hypothetical protein